MRWRLILTMLTIPNDSYTFKYKILFCSLNTNESNVKNKFMRYAATFAYYSRWLKFYGKTMLDSLGLWSLPFVIEMVMNIE